MGANLELWTYRLFKNDSLYLEEIFRKSTITSPPGSLDGLTAGKKAALSRRTGSYTVEQHFTKKPVLMKDLAQSIREFALGLDLAIEEAPKKYYIAYKISQNIICMEIYKHRVLLYIKFDPKKVDAPKKLHPRDMTSIGHYGTGDLELPVRTKDDLELVKPLLEQAYQKVGG